jgi:hypothetical protein
VVASRLCGNIFHEENSIDVHSNIRFPLALMLNVDVLMSYQLSTRSGGEFRHQERNHE